MKKEFFEIAGYEFVIYFHPFTSRFLFEAKSKGQPLINNYSYIKHQPHIPDGQYHIHVYNKSNQIFAVNKDGSTHDGFHGVRIPNAVYKELITRFNGWIFPNNHITETTSYFYLFSPIDILSNDQILNELKIITEERGLNSIFKDVKKSIYESAGELDLIDRQLSNRLDSLYLELVKRKAQIIK